MGEALTLEALSLETGPKLIVYVATLYCAGAATTLALGSAGVPGAGWPVASLGDRVRRLAIVAGIVALVALVLRAIAHAVVIDGAVSDLTVDTIKLVVVDSRWGRGWRWQWLAAAVVTIAAWRVRGAAGVPLLVVAVALWCVATPVPGHGAGSPWQRVLHTVHVGASGAWIGTVLVLASSLGRVATSSRLMDLQPVIRRFSPWALMAAALAGTSGVVLAVIYVAALDQLWTTPYGRLLMTKLGAVAAIGACGFGNWQRSRADRVPSAGLIRAEAVFAVVVLVVTAILTETEHN